MTQLITTNNQQHVSKVTDDVGITLLHLSPTVITLRSLLHLRAVITFRSSTSWRSQFSGGEEAGAPASIASIVRLHKEGCGDSRNELRHFGFGRYLSLQMAVLTSVTNSSIVSRSSNLASSSKVKCSCSVSLMLAKYFKVVHNFSV